MSSAPSLSSYGREEFTPGLDGTTFGAITPVVASRMNENATEIDFGVPVCKGTTKDEHGRFNVKPLDSNADVVLGISIRESIVGAADPSTGLIGYKQNAEVPFLGGPGGVRATPFEAVEDGDQVIAVVAGTGSKLSGSKSGVVGTGRLVCPNFVWDGACAANVQGRIKFAASQAPVATT